MTAATLTSLDRRRVAEEERAIIARYHRLRGSLRPELALRLATNFSVNIDEVLRFRPVAPQPVAA